MFSSWRLIMIPVLIISSHYTSWITYSILMNLKNGSYITPVWGWKFQSWIGFLVYSLGVMQIFYFVSGIMQFIAYKLTLEHFGSSYPGVILNILAVVMWTVAMMYFRVKEVPTRDGWMAIALIVIASLLAMNAGRNIKP